MARFGKYELISRLATGGMGETYLADLNAVAGVTKRVVIKKMLPSLTTDAEQVEAFVQEARLSASFSHGNIAQVFDFGEVDGEYFLAMEYVHGQSLYTLLKRAPLAGYERIPYPVSAYIVVELLKALHYAHTRTGPDGRPLGVVHRDVTPDNVLISYEGDVKLVDFGVAKSQAKGRTETEPGLVKGKFRYLSPEQATAYPLDARSDIFSTGTLLYEMLTGQHLFQGQAHVVMNEIVRGSYPSVRVKAPDVPDVLVNVLAGALKRERTDRFQSAREMQETLSRWLVVQSAEFSGDVVRELMGEVFAAELQKLGTPFVRHPNATKALRAMREPPTLPPGLNTDSAVTKLPDTTSMRTPPEAPVPLADMTTTLPKTKRPLPLWPFALGGLIGALAAAYFIASSH